jgi:YD repeat-containing protein
MRDVAQCVADCFESTLAYSTPAYISLDVPRSVTLLYRSGRAKPMGRLALDVTDANTAVTSFRLQLADPNGSYVTFANNSTSLFFAKNTAGSTRIAAEFDANAIPTSAKQYTAYVTSYSGSTQGVTGSVAVRIIVINDQNSPLGAGVDMPGFQRIFTNQPGGVLVTDGSGSASFFTGSCSPGTTCAFTAPAGDFSKLSTTSLGYRRIYPDSTVVQFNSSGQETSVGDRFGTTTTISYAWSAENNSYMPAKITDPTGDSITFSYRTAAEVSYKAGSLGAISWQGAHYSAFGVLPVGNLEHLVDADHLCCDVAIYDSQHRLIQFNKRAGPATGYAYRYGATLDYSEASAITLANGTMASPRVTLRNAADALLASAAAGNGTSTTPLAVPSDLRAVVVTPRGDTTFYRLNRFGSADTAKAPLTNAAVAQFDTMTGQLLRSVSPTGDVTRYTWSANKLTQVFDSTAGKTVNYGYETSSSLPNHISGSVAEQWFTYDHTKTGWPLLTSKVGVSTATPTTYLFDAYGRPTSVSDPSGHTTSYGYQTAGLRNRTSVTTPNGQSQTFGYDTWGRVVSTTDP